MANTTEKRGQWGSRWGFILAAAGSAVGLGNIWRFPYLTGENGGGAFVLVYLICVIFIGLPLLYNEIGLGRLTGKNPIGAVEALEKKKGLGGLPWWLTGLLCIMVCFFVLSYYSVIAGWTIGYIYNTVIGAKVEFGEFIGDAGTVIPLLGVFMLMTIGIVLGGVSGGIEKAAKILMPMLLIIVVCLIAYSLTLPGAMAGVEYYLTPDLSKINGDVVLAALGQAFFSMSVGWGLMVTYGSYLPKDQNMVGAGAWVAFADTVVALLGGLMIFPAVFAFSKDPAGGPTLVFQVLPEVFAAMPGGAIVGGLFFLLLMVAALTSSISMLEVPVSYLLDEKKWSRKKAAWAVGGLAFLFGIPSALSQAKTGLFSVYNEVTNPIGGIYNILPEGMSFLDVMDQYWGTMAVVVICLLFSLIVGWVIPTKHVADELDSGSLLDENGNIIKPGIFNKGIIGGLSLATLWVFFIRFVCPIVIILMLVFKVSE